MATTFRSALFSKKGGLGVLTLVGFVLIAFVIGAWHFWPSADDLVAQPLKVDKLSISAEQKLSEIEPPETSIIVESPPEITSAVSLSEPRPKISPELVEKLKAQNKKESKQRIKLLIDARDAAALEELKQKVSEAGGSVEVTFSVGDVAVVELPADAVESISEQDGVVEIAQERDYIAFVADRIPAFSIDTAWENNHTGKNIKIAILDTGVGPHNGITVAAAQSFVENEDEADQNGHGTHVARIAQAVAPDAVIYNAKVLSKSGAGKTSQIIAGINWALDTDNDPSTDDGADIISLSFGGMFTELDGPLASAVKEAIDQGVIFVAAAGNCRQGCSGFFGVTTPANVKEVIAVGAVDDNNVVASFSSGDTFDGYIKPDIIAPGVDITSAWLNNGQKTQSGTSMSAPFAAGVIALLLEKESLAQVEVKQKLTSTAQDLGDTGWDTSYGAGLIDVPALLELQTISESIPEPNETIIVPEINLTIPEIIVTIPVNITAEVNEIIKQRVTVSDRPDDNETVSDFPGFYVTRLVKVLETAGQESSTPSEVRIKISEGSILYEPSDTLQTSQLSSDNKLEIQNHRAGYIDYDDDYTYRSSGNDGVAWGGSDLSVRLQGFESGTEVICYDWCDDGEWDDCFADTVLDMDACILDFNSLSNICSRSTDGKCWAGGLGMDYDHPIDTSFSGDKWTCEVDAKYYLNCLNPDINAGYGTPAEPYYVISPRQYDCDNQGGTFSDIGDYGSSEFVLAFKQGISCGSGKGCDQAIDDDLADFGPSGTNAPAEPCRILDGTIDCDSDSECMSGSYCDCQGGCAFGFATDYCCPNGQEWLNSQCRVPCTEGYTGVRQCNGNDVEREFKFRDCTSEWEREETCGSTEKCSVGACVQKTCSDFGLSSSCTSLGSRQRTGNTVYECQDQVSGSGQILCLAPISSLGDSDFCSVLGSFGKKCRHSEYDCDQNSQCLTGFCDGGLFSAPDGCCNPGDQWNSGTKKCMQPDGSGCISANECINRYCVHSRCWNAPYKDNDGYCDRSAGEPSTAIDCKKGEGESCSSGGECQSSVCRSGKCEPRCKDNDDDGYGTAGFGCEKSDTLRDCNDNVATIYPGAPEVCDNYDNNCNGINNENNVCCGNGACDNGETKNTCSQDCYGKLDIINIVNAPSVVDQGQTVQIRARVKNIGTITDTLKMEAAVVPDYWEGVIFADTVEAQAYSSTAKCCPGNDYYDAKEVTLASGESQDIVFSVIAPTAGTIDDCWSNRDYKYAWDSSHTVFVGLYEECGIGYKDKDKKDIKVKDKPCSKQSDCASSEQCVFSGTAGICLPKACSNTCDTLGYYCSGSTLYQCRENAEGCYEKEYIQFCKTGTDCVDGQSSCVEDAPSVPSATLALEEASENTPVLAQPGDSIIAQISYAEAETVELEYDSIFTLDTSTCQQGRFSLTTDKKCTFTVSDSAPKGAYEIGLKGKSPATVEVVTEPQFIIVTNKPKLRDRFNNAPSVDTLLKEAYKYAYDNGGIVYDLDAYNIPAHPWDKFNQYFETYNHQQKKDNTHSLNVADFIRKKCNGCKNIMILGDDFVVPHYRRDLDMSIWFGFARDVDEIYTDVAYVQRTDKKFNEFEELFYQDEHFDGKKVLIVLPDSVSAEMRQEIDRLTSFLENHEEIQARVSERDSSEVVCNSHLAFTYYDGWTLVIIGNENTNPAMKCFPFVTDSELETITIERNPWDGRAYAVVVNSNNVDTLQILNDLLEKGKYTELDSSGWLIARTAGNVAAGAAIGAATIAIVGGTGGAGAFLIVAVGAGVTTDVIDGAECYKFQGGECVEFAAGLLLPFGIEKIGKPLVKSAIDVFGPQLRYFYESLGGNTIGLLKRMGKRGQLNPGGGFDKLSGVLKKLDRAGDPTSKELIDFVAKSGDEFRAFTHTVAKSNEWRALVTINVAKTTGLTKLQLREIAGKQYIPAKMFVKSIDNLGDEFAYIVDDTIYYSNGKLRPAFRGLRTNMNVDPNLATKQLKEDFNRIGDNGFDVPKQIGIGAHSDQASVSFTPDFGVSVDFALRSKDPGTVIVYDKRFGAFIDSQSTLKQMYDRIPTANVKGPNLEVSTVYGAALGNNELSLLGKPNINHVVGWYSVFETADGDIAKKFVHNPKYIGDPADWEHITSINRIKQLHIDNDIANYDKIVELRGDTTLEFGIHEGNTDFWPREVI